MQKIDLCWGHRSPGLTISRCDDEPLATWHIINVNARQLQADANLITIGSTVIIIDAGHYREAKSAVLPYFKALGIEKIDHFFISHPHKDHYEWTVDSPGK